MIKEIVIPDIGEKVESGLVVSVLVKKGDNVEVDQSLIEVETDKAVVEIPSTEKGKVIEILVKEDDEVKTGQVIAKVDTVGEESKTPAGKKPVEKSEKEPEQKSEAEPDDVQEAKPETEDVKIGKKEDKAGGKKPLQEKAESEKPTDKPEEIPKKSAGLAPASPSVRRLARELGADINKIKGTGPGSRISAEDIKKYVKSVMTRKSETTSRSAEIPELPDFTRWGEIKRESLTKVRRIIGENMSLAWQVVPHVTQFDKADITAVEKFRKEYSPDVEKVGGKLTATTIIMKVVVSALQRFPRFNASLDSERREIIYKKYYNIAVAVDTDRGLLVPVLRDVDKKSISEIAVELTDLAERTRNKKVKPDELEGGTFTISNQGGIGGTDFTPIVYWPQVAILGISRATIEPRYMDDKFEPRTILPLSLSYDHRVIDGADAARFLRWVVEALEHPLLLNLNS